MAKIQTQQAQRRDVVDLMTNFGPEDFHGFDVRITADEWGRCGKGDLIVVVDAKTHADISEPLLDLFAEALAISLHTAYPDTACRLHRPYDRGKRQSWSADADCTCALVFESRLRAAIREVKLNKVDTTMTKVRLAQQALLADKPRPAR
jgi:hypothetical protein